MGRGRAKAKQTKVARALKYSSGETDLERLQRELAEASGEAPLSAPPAAEADDEDDLYSAYADDDEAED